MLYLLVYQHENGDVFHKKIINVNNFGRFTYSLIKRLGLFTVKGILDSKTKEYVKWELKTIWPQVKFVTLYSEKYYEI